MYDFITHTRKRETTTVYPKKVIIVEGILILAEKTLREKSNLVEVGKYGISRFW